MNSAQPRTCKWFSSWRWNRLLRTSKVQFFAGFLVAEGSASGRAGQFSPPSAAQSGGPLLPRSARVRGRQARARGSGTEGGVHAGGRGSTWDQRCLPFCALGASLLPPQSHPLPEPRCCSVSICRTDSFLLCK